jgi:hypothetical protein
MAHRILSSRAALVAAALLACESEVVTPELPADDPTALFWRIGLNQQALNLATVAPYDTCRIVATAIGLDGAPLAGETIVKFRSPDPEKVLVGNDGFVRAILPLTRLPIVVTLTHGRLTRTDTVLVNVTSAAPPAIGSLSLEPNPPDSAKVALGFLGPYFTVPNLVTRVLDASGVELTNVVVWIESSDPVIADYRNVQRELGVNSPGRVTFRATTLAYGTALVDTLEYTVGMPLFGGMFPRAGLTLNDTIWTFSPATVTVGAGAHLYWSRNYLIPSYDITFDDPGHVLADTFPPVFGPGCGEGNASGNITPFDLGPVQFGVPSLNSCGRYFVVPGTYRYHSAALNASGTIIVVDESAAAVAQRTSAPPR